MARRDQKPPTVPTAAQTDQAAVSNNDYEQLYLVLYAYCFGAISFLELLATYEEALGIRPEASEKDDAA